MARVLGYIARSLSLCYSSSYMGIAASDLCACVDGGTVDCVLVSTLWLRHDMQLKDYIMLSDQASWYIYTYHAIAPWNCIHNWTTCICIYVNLWNGYMTSDSRLYIYYDHSVTYLIVI